MGRISPRAADKLRQTVQKVANLPPQGAGFADPGLPIRRAITTTDHLTGATEDVLLIWGAQGAETPGAATRDVVPAYNRFNDLAEDTEVLIARVGPGWEILSQRPTAQLFGRGCGTCNESAGNLTVDLGGGLLAATHYTFSPMCGGLLPITFEYDTGTEWEGGPGSLSVTCDDDGTVPITATLDIAGTAIGDVTITITDGTNTWVWESDTAFIPSNGMLMRRTTGPIDCPCSTWLPYPCLVPVTV